MDLVRCPECGHIQRKKEIDIDKPIQDKYNSFFISQIKKLNVDFLTYVNCEQCGIQFIEEENEK